MIVEKRVTKDLKDVCKRGKLYRSRECVGEEEREEKQRREAEKSRAGAHASDEKSYPGKCFFSCRQQSTAEYKY